MTFGVTYSYTFKIIMFDICKAASFLKPNTLPNIEVYMQNLDGLKVDQPIIYQYDVLQNYQFDCGPISYNLKLSSGDKAPSWAKIMTEESKIAIDLNLQQKPFTKSFDITAYL